MKLPQMAKVALLSIGAALLTAFSAVAADPVAPREDYLWINNDEPGPLELKADVSADYGSFFSDLIETGSDLTTVSVSGLPTGLKFDTKKRTLSGAPTKAGIFWTTVTAKNKNGFQHSRMIPITVLDANGDAPAIPDTPVYVKLDAGGELITGGYNYYVDIDAVELEQGATSAKPVSVKASGLPAGLQLQRDEYEEYYYISGIPTKAGRFKVTFTVTYDNKKTAKQEIWLLVKDGGSRYVDVQSEDSAAGTATKSGVYAMGANVSLSAKAAKGYVFAGWYNDEGDRLVLAKNADYRTASASHTLYDYELNDERPESFVKEIRANFVAADEDILDVGLDGELWELIYGEPDMFEFGAYSASLPKLTIKGLPKGIKFNFFDDFYYFLADGTTVPGRYTVTVTAQNQSKHSVTATLAIEVRGESANIAVDDELGDEFIPGEPIEPIDLSDAFDFANNKTFAVSGLPKGLVWNTKANAKKGIAAYTITGTPTVPGEYLVVFSAKIPYEEEVNGKMKIVTVTEYRTARIVVLPYPELDVYVDTNSDDDDAVGGKVVGVGNYPSGTKVTLKATANPGYVFAGWGGEGIGGSTAGYLAAKSPTFALTTGPDNRMLVADFVQIKRDYLWINEADDIYLYTSENVADNEETAEAIARLIETRSLPTISVSGLPAGVKWDAKTFTLSGKPTKAGVYYATVSGKNASGYAHSRIVKFVVDDAEEPEEINEAGIWEDSGSYEGESDYDVYFGDGIYTGYANVFGVFNIPASPKGSAVVKATVKGLPAGLAYMFYESGVYTDYYWDEEEEDYVEYEDTYPAGIDIYSNAYLTKPGRYTLTFDVTYADKSKAKTVRTVTVRDSGSRYVEVVLDEDSDATMGTVAGSGVYAYGQPLSKVVAKANKGNVFAGWYFDGPLDASDAKFNDIDYRTASLAKAIFGSNLTYGIVDYLESVTLHASFATVEEDKESIVIGAYDEILDEFLDGASENPTWDLTPYFELGLDELMDILEFYNVDITLQLSADSLSLPTVTVKGLPTGFKFANNAILVTDPSKLKPGVYPVTVTATNVSKATKTATINISVPNLSCEALPNLDTAKDAYFTVIGVDVAESLDGLEYDLTLGEGYEGYALAATGLPSGLKLVKATKNGRVVYTLSGKPTKVGVYTVTFTATKGKDKQIATMTLNVVTELPPNVLPEWAVGTFEGPDYYNYGGRITLTARPSGTISGKTYFSSFNGTVAQIDDDVCSFEGKDTTITLYRRDDDNGIDTVDVQVVRHEVFYNPEYDESYVDDYTIYEGTVYRNVWGQKPAVEGLPFFAENVNISLGVYDGYSVDLTIKKSTSTTTAPTVTAVLRNEEGAVVDTTSGTLIVEYASADDTSASLPLVFEVPEEDGYYYIFPVTLWFDISNPAQARADDVYVDLY